MASSQPLEEVLKALQSQNELLLQLVRDATGANPARSSLPSGAGRERASSRSNEMHKTPPLRPISSPTLTNSEFGFPGSLRHSRRQTLEQTGDIRPSLEPKHIPASLHSTYTTGSHEVHEDDIHFLPLLEPSVSQQQHMQPQPLAMEHRGVSQPLDMVHFEDKDLLNYLFHTDFSDGAAIAMSDFIRRRAGTSIDWAQSLRHFAAYENESHGNSTCEVYKIGADCLARQVQVEDGKGPQCKCDDADMDSDHSNSCSVPQEADAVAVWDKIKSVNHDAQDTVGRITIVQEPTALAFGSLHFAMAKYFDMNELLTHLVTSNGNGGKTTAYMNRAFPPEPSPRSTTSLSAIDARPQFQASPFTTVAVDPYIRQRSFFFAFKYYTVVQSDNEPAPWERFDNRPADKRSQDHIDIAECSSVLALSLSGDPTQTRVRRRRGKPPKEGFVFNTFAPWQLLNIQSFPDDEHTDRSEDEGKVLLNGPHAFLEALVVEYQDATRRNRILHDKITKLITPDINFMFDNKIRDKLLFEDKHFTYIRRYFWAYMSLGVINTGIKAMLAAYDETFTPDFWAGTHPTLWPHPEPDSPSGQQYLARMASLRADLDRVLADLWTVYLKNKETRREIQSLREQLFSGSSIMESRRAIEQGDNIRILTLSSMIFLPLTFVTSVFGITVFEIPATDWRFPTTMVCVCVPFIVLLILLQSRSVNHSIHGFFEGLRAKTSTLRRRAVAPSDRSSRARPPARDWKTLFLGGVRLGNESDKAEISGASVSSSAAASAARRRSEHGSAPGLPAFPRGAMSRGEKKRLWEWARGSRGRRDNAERV